MFAILLLEYPIIFFPTIFWTQDALLVDLPGAIPAELKEPTISCGKAGG